MESSESSFSQLGTAAKQFLRRLATMGENRVELLTVEVQEERERVLHAFLLALGVAAFGLLAGATLTAAIAVLLWTYSPTAVLLAMAGLYGVAGAYLYSRLQSLLQNWQTFPASLKQIRKDRECLEKILA